MKIAFNGCSFTRGDGFPIVERDTSLYYGQVAKHLGCEFDNNAKGGYSNLRIFHSVYEDIASEKYDTVFVQWSAQTQYHISHMVKSKTKSMVLHGIPFCTDQRHLR